MSASAGVAPAWMMAITVAMAVIGVVMTSSPGPTSSAQAEFDGFHSIGDSDAESRAAKFCPTFLELLYFISKNKSARAKTAFDRRQLLPRQFLRLGCEIVHPNHGVEPQ